MKKIALLYDKIGRSKGGVEAWIYYMSNALCIDNYEFCIYTFDIDEINEFSKFNVDIIQLNKKPRIKLPGISWYSSLLKIRKELKEKSKDIDIFWARSYRMAYAAAKVSKKRPVIYIQATPISFYDKLFFSNFTRETLITKIKRKKTLFESKLAEKLAMNKVDYLVFLSETRKNEVLDYYSNKYYTKSKVIPPGVDIELYKPKKKEWDGVLKTISVCRLSVEKNIELHIEALSILKEKNCRFKTFIVGDGPQLENLKKLAIVKGIQEDIVFTGRQKDISQYLNISDIFVLPSIYEGFGSAYLEALASGLPCIAIKNNPPKINVAADYIIKDKETGILLNQNDPDELADALLFFYNNPKQLDVYSSNARCDVEKRYLWRNTINELMKLSKSV